MKKQRKIGKYILRKLLGEGAMGKVYLAFDPMLDRQVAIKLIRMKPNISDTVREEFKQRFFQEGRIGARLAHPNIVSIYDMGEYRGQPYLVMEYIQGMVLSASMDPDNPMQPEAFLFILEQIAQGLDEAHAEGIIHRDIKPDNIIITDTGIAKILDFGMGRLDKSRITKTGEFVGTPSYSSPEQIQGKEVDHRADIFALGVMAHELITGKSPFDGSTISAVLFQITSGDPVISDCPASLNISQRVLKKLFSKALAKDPDKRFQSGAELIRAIRDVFLGTRIVPSPLLPSSPAPSQPAPVRETDKTASYPVQFWETPEPKTVVDQSAETQDLADIKPVPDAAPSPAVAAIPEPVSTVQAEKLGVPLWAWAVVAVFLLGVVTTAGVIIWKWSQQEETLPADQELVELTRRWQAALDASDLDEAERVLTRLQEKGAATTEHSDAFNRMRQNILVQVQLDELNEAWKGEDLDKVASVIEALADLGQDVAAQRARLVEEERKRLVDNLETRLKRALARSSSKQAEELLARLDQLGVDTSQYRVEDKAPPPSTDSELERLKARFNQALNVSDMDQATTILSRLESLADKELPLERQRFEELLIAEMDRALDTENLRRAKQLAGRFRERGLVVHRLDELQAFDQGKRSDNTRERLQTALDNWELDQAQTLLARLQANGEDVSKEQGQMNQLKEELLATKTVLVGLKAFSYNFEALVDIHRKSRTASAQELFQQALSLKENGAEQQRIMAFMGLAAERGQSQAQLALAVYFEELGFHAEANGWYRLAQEAGLVEAAFRLGKQYYAGRGVSKNQSEALRYYLIAAKGMPEAERLASLMYFYGQGVAKDDRKAFKHLSAAAKKGLAEAQYTLGIFYERGTGTKKSMEKAVMWYRRAASQGHQDSLNRLELLKNR